MERVLETTTDNQVFERCSNAYIASKVITALGKDKFNLKGRYVVLAPKCKKIGYYLIPVFDKDGLDNISCLSKEVKEKADAGILKVGSVYRLHAKCRFIVSPNSHHKRCENQCEDVQRKYPICKVGKPAQDCWKNFATKYGEWDYGNPECACWDFNELDEVDLASIRCTGSLSLSELSCALSELSCLLNKS